MSTDRARATGSNAAGLAWALARNLAAAPPGRFNLASRSIRQDLLHPPHMGAGNER